jgi:hypothetical protein
MSAGWRRQACGGDCPAGPAASQIDTASTWLELDLDPAWAAEVELLVRLDGVAHRFDLAQHHGGIGLAGRDPRDQLRDVGPVVAVSHVDGEVLVHCSVDGEEHVIGRIDADDAERPALGQCLDSPGGDEGGRVAGLSLLALGIRVGDDPDRHPEGRRMACSPPMSAETGSDSVPSDRQATKPSGRTRTASDKTTSWV